MMRRALHLLTFHALALGAGSTARAESLLDAWSYTGYVRGDSMVGKDAWEGGFYKDEWKGYTSWGSGTSDSYVMSTTDNNATDYGGDWGEGGARDNWLVNTEVGIIDGALRVPFNTGDDDSVGVICRFQDGENFILGLMTDEGGSSPVGDTGPVTEIIKVSGGVAEILESGTTTYTASTDGGLELRCDDDTITLSLWPSYDSDWTSPTVELVTTDPAPGVGESWGFYAYDAGGSDGTITLFGEVQVLAVDDDDDGVADDTDNCEEDSNVDQADADADGLGDACDPWTDSDGDGLSDSDETTTWETDPLDTDTDGDGLSDGDEVLTYGTDAVDLDTDNDHLSDGEELLVYGTDPLDSDTDHGGVDDGSEVIRDGTDPLDPSDDITGGTDTGEDTGTIDTGSVDTGSIDTGSVDTGSIDTHDTGDTGHSGTTDTRDTGTTDTRDTGEDSGGDSDSDLSHDDSGTPDSGGLGGGGSLNELSVGGGWGCGCASTGSPSAWAGLLGALLALRRRRG